MKKSVDHILTTHTGSLPRGQELNDLLIADEAGEKVDKAKLTEMIEKRVAHVMEKQRWAGVDVANDGEQGRVGFQTYVPQADVRIWRRIEAALSARNGCSFRCSREKFMARIPEDRKGLRVPRMRRASSNIHDKEAIKTELLAFKRHADGDQAAIPRNLLCRAVAGHHRHDNAQCALHDLRGLSRRDRARDAL